MRYAGQGHEVSVPLPKGMLGAEHLPAVTAAFENAYRALYGRSVPDVPVEVIHWRLTVTGPQPEMNFGRSRTAPFGAGVKGTRQAYFPEHDGYVEAPVYDRYALKPGDRFAGPAIVEERESTLVLGARGQARVDERLNVIVEIAHE